MTDSKDVDPNDNPLEIQARRFDALETELRLAADHARVSALHYRNTEIARAGAHALAMMGHLANAHAHFEEAAIDHAAHATTVV